MTTEWSFLQSHNSIGLVVSNEKIFWNFGQSEHIMGPGSHVGFPISAKNKNLVYDHPMNISGKFGSNLFSGFREEDLNVKS